MFYIYNMSLELPGHSEDRPTISVDSGFAGVRNVEEITDAGIVESLGDVDFEIRDDQRSGVDEVDHIGRMTDTRHGTVILKSFVMVEKNLFRKLLTVINEGSLTKYITNSHSSQKYLGNYATNFQSQ